MKKYSESFVSGEDSDEPQAMTLPNPPPEMADQFTTIIPLHRPDRPRASDKAQKPRDDS